MYNIYTQTHINVKEIIIFAIIWDNIDFNIPGTKIAR